MPDGRRTWLSRRGFVRSLLGVAGAATVADPAAARGDDGVTVGDWLAGADNYDGTVADVRGTDRVTVEVGPDAFVFAPPAVRVDPGTTVRFEWMTDGHNVEVESRPDDADWAGHVGIADRGFTYEYTFEVEGVYAYYCAAHYPREMRGAIVVGDVDVETGTSTPTGTADSSGAETWTVEMNDENRFVPEELTVAAGDTVVWENVGAAPHSVTAYVDGIPEDADYWASGGHESEQIARANFPDEGVVETGETFEHTFETEGVHEYFCIPHESAGMDGSVTVTPDRSTPSSTATASDSPTPTTRSTSSDDTSVTTPGMGVGSAVAAVAGLAAMLGRWGESE